MPLTIKGKPVADPDTSEQRGTEARLALLHGALRDARRIGEEIDETVERLEDLGRKLSKEELMHHPKRDDAVLRYGRLLSHLNELDQKIVHCHERGDKAWNAMTPEEKKELVDIDHDLPLWAVWAKLRDAQ